MNAPVDRYWLSQFRERMADFARVPSAGQVSVSIKIRVEAGCFHREHSPEAYRLIDEYIQRQALAPERLKIEEHESGPEILLFAGVAIGVINFSAAVINLIVAILRARADGIRKGDHPCAPLELIVRRIDSKGQYIEEKVLRIPFDQQVDAQKIAAAISRPNVPPPKPARSRKRKAQPSPKGGKKSA